MGIFSRLFERRSGLANPESWLLEALGGRPTASGQSVNEATALTISAVWQCVNILAQNTGTLPLPVYKETDHGRDKARKHPLWRVLNVKANPWMTSNTFRMALMVHLVLWQAAYAHIERDGAGRVIALWPLLPDRTRPVSKSGLTALPAGMVSPGDTLVFQTTLSDGTLKYLPADQVLYIPGLTFNGVEGLPLVKKAREVLGLLLAMQDHGGRFFSNGATPSGVISTDQTLTPDQKRQMLLDVHEQVKGASKAHEMLLLSNGTKFQQIGVNPQNAQLLESRRFQIEEVARWFNMPPHKLGLMDKGGASYATVEQMQMQFVTETLRPWLVLIEQAMTADLLTGSEAETYVIEHNIEGLLRGDSKSRGEFYGKLFQIGALSPNDALRLENRNTIGPEGDQRFVPANMIPLEQTATISVQGRAQLLAGLTQLATASALDPGAGADEGGDANAERIRSQVGSGAPGRD